MVKKKLKVVRKRTHCRILPKMCAMVWECGAKVRGEKEKEKRKRKTMDNKEEEGWEITIVSCASPGQSGLMHGIQ